MPDLELPETEVVTFNQVQKTVDSLFGMIEMIMKSRQAPAKAESSEDEDEDEELDPALKRFVMKQVKKLVRQETQKEE